MEKIIKIGNKEVKLSNNVAWLMEYRDQFGKDAAQELIPMMSTIIETITTGLSSYSNGKINIRELAESIEGRSFEIMMPLYSSELSILAINITWAMAKAADESIDPPKKWVKQFDSFPFDEIVPELWKMNAEGFSSSKNLTRLRTLLGKAREAWDEMQKDKETQPASESTK